MPKNWWLRRKTIGAALFAGVLGLALGGCGTTPGEAAPGEEGERPLVLTTFTVLADIARAVAGEHLRVESITKVGAEVHGYEPTPGDIRRAAEAALVLENGLGLEGWFDRLLAETDAPRVTVAAGVTPIPLAGTDDVSNPHAWMSAVSGAAYVEAIVAAFSALLPAEAASFAEAGAAYQAELAQIHDELRAAVAALPPSHRTLVTCEGAFSYLARDAGLGEVYLWPVNAEQQATPQQVAAAIRAVQDQQIPAVFCESTVSDRAMQQVVAATGAAFGGVLYVDSLSDATGPVPSYLALLRYDAQLIVAGLTGGTP